MRLVDIIMDFSPIPKHRIFRELKEGDDLLSKKIDWLIVDHYGIDEEWQKELKGNYKKLMVIDDLADRNHKCDILLDQTFGRQYQDYKAFVLNSCKLLLGSQYTLLRPEFAEWRQYSLDRRKKPVFKELLISMGGIDSTNMTEQVVKKLELCNLPSDLKITVVMGIFAPHLEKVKRSLNNLPYQSDVRVDVNNMAEIMANADITIGSSGITTWERCCLGLPAIQFITAKNQSIIGELLARKKAIKLLQNLDQLPEMIEDVISWMKDVTIIAQEVSDGMGSMRVSSKMIDKII